MNRITSKDGTKIAFDRSGKGAALILVGGAFQYRAIDERTTQLASLLAQHFTVYNYDRRGRGDSTDTPLYAIEREIEDLDALINEAGGSAYVFGMSSGAVLALHAVAHGLTIKKLALYEPPFGNPGVSRSAAESYTRQLKAFLAEDRRGDAVALAMTSFGTPAEAVAGMRQSPVWPMFEAVAPTLAYDDAIMGNGSLPIAIMKKVDLPTLVMDGGDSPAFMHEAAQAVADGLSHGQHRTLEGQTHAYQPEVLAPVLAEFYRA
jgi:pimeloyl-ACP methyl ester carboxylesterase